MTPTSLTTVARLPVLCITSPVSCCCLARTRRRAEEGRQGAGMSSGTAVPAAAAAGPVKHVDWVEQVLQGLAAAVAADPQARQVGVSIGDLQRRLTGDPADGSPAAEAIGDALADLERLGLVDLGSGAGAKLSQAGVQLAAGSLRSTWPAIQQLYLTDEQLAFLRAAAALCEQRHPKFALLREVSWREVNQRLGWQTDDDTIAHDLAARLAQVGLLAVDITLGDSIELYPTYAGVVRATEAEQAALRELIVGLLPDWETTTVEFKRELNLKRNKEKAELVRDVLALATTKASGRRWLVIGFDPKTHQFAQSVDPAITQDRLEQILAAYAATRPASPTGSPRRWRTSPPGTCTCATAARSNHPPRPSSPTLRPRAAPRRARRRPCRDRYEQVSREPGGMVSTTGPRRSRERR